MRARVFLVVAVALLGPSCSGDPAGTSEATVSATATATTTREPATTVVSSTSTIAPTTTAAPTTTTEPPTTTTTIDAVATYEAIVLPGNCLSLKYPTGSAMKLSQQPFFQQLADTLYGTAVLLRGTTWPTPEVAAAAEKVAAGADTEAGFYEQAAGAVSYASMVGFIRSAETFANDPSRTEAAELRRLIGADHVPTERELSDACAAAGLT